MKIKAPLNACAKIISTPSQASLTADERRKNLKDVFKINYLPHEHVTLIDDLLTTGSTTSELAKAFLAAGAQQVDVWCIARTL